MIENNNIIGLDTDMERIESMANPPRRFYRTRAEAQKKRRTGERVYYKRGEGYYVRRPTSREKTIWEQLLGG